MKISRDEKYRTEIRRRARKALRRALERLERADLVDPPPKGSDDGAVLSVDGLTYVIERDWGCDVADVDDVQAVELFVRWLHRHRAELHAEVAKEAAKRDALVAALAQEMVLATCDPTGPAFRPRR